MDSANSVIFAFLRRFSSVAALLLWLQLLVCMDAQSQTQRDEVQVLMKFRALYPDNFFSVLPTGYWDGWNATDENPCAWVGVTCGANLTVEQLDLSNWGLDLTIWGLDLSFSGLHLDGGAFQILASLSDLRHLDLSSNTPDLGGNTFLSLKDDVGELTGLTWLDLSQNSFVGSIPLNITSCRSLRYLSLENNLLQGEIPDLSSLVDLQVLSLAGNNLSGAFPNWLKEMNSLIRVDLSRNILNGSIPALSKLTKLLDLNLDSNYFTSFEELELPIAFNLKTLVVSGNQLEGSIPLGMTKMPSLQLLNMSNNRLTGRIPSGLGIHLHHGFYLDLSQNELTGEIPGKLLQPSPGLENLSNLSQLISLNLSHNNLSGYIPVPLENGPLAVSYIDLDFSHNQLSGPMPFIFNNSIFIVKLWLQNNMLHGDIVDVLLGGLVAFHLDEGVFSHIFNNSYGYAMELRFQSNLFTGDLSRMANSWNDFSKLLILDLSNNNLHMSTKGAISDPWRSTFESLNSNSSLQEFRVGGNNFSGTFLPAGFDSSYNTSALGSYLRVLDFSSCHLQGEISGVIFNSTWLQSIQVLNFSNNELTGQVPDSIGTLPNLVVLNVSNNHLSGQLPAIQPSSELYNPSFFAGNALCGVPLPPCSSARKFIQWWVYLVIALSATIAVGSLLIATWLWRVYHQRHQQDGDLIKALMERESITIMSLGDLKKATKNFAKSAQIGEGGFGKVYMGTLNNGTKVAVKKSKREGTEKYKEEFLNEVRILSQVNHRNLVKLLGCCMENKTALLVLEFVPNGTLQEHLQGKTGGGVLCLSWAERVRIAVQAADALNYLHTATTFAIYHRDVKSANILLNNDLNAKVADFGISKLDLVEGTHVSTAAIGTLGYIDPEYYTSCQLTSKSDVYSFGVVLLELISAKPALDPKRGDEERSLKTFAEPFIASGDLQPLIDPALMETYSQPIGRESMLNVGKLAMQCLEMQSRSRPNMNEVLVELQSLLLELDDTSKLSPSMEEDRNPNSQQDNTIFLSGSFSIDSATCSDRQDLRK